MNKEVPSNPRAARDKMYQVQALRHLFRFTLAGLQREGIETGFSTRVDEQLNQLLNRLEQASKGRIESRRKLPRVLFEMEEDVPEYFLFIDECGLPDTFNPKFPVFCLSGCIIANSVYGDFEKKWMAWKQINLGDSAYVIHEPDVRLNTSMFHRKSESERQALLDSLNKLLESLDFICIASVIDMRAMQELYPEGKIDDFLPRYAYLMTMDFVLERFVHFLDGDVGRGIVVAESRGPREDALVHAEFIRLLVEGTQFVAPGTFRRYLRPYMEFYRKRKNCAGLQVADLAARPFAEKVIGRVEGPPRWELFKSKLYDGRKNAPHKYGLKVFPLVLGKDGNDPFSEQFRIAKGSAEALPFTDCPKGQSRN
jgi:hypothetical protein